MILRRTLTLTLFIAAIAATLFQWNIAVGFQPLSPQWWAWLIRVLVQVGSLPENMLYPLAWSFGIAFVLILVVNIWLTRASSRNINGDVDARNTHGSARWATWRDVKNTGLVRDRGATVGGYKRPTKTVTLRHDGPEHIMAFAPTRSGKGVALVIPTLLSWVESVLVLDIKGENYALSAGWRKTIGQRVLRFDPAAVKGSVRYNPLAEVRLGTDHEIADCQNIASMIIDPDGKGLKDFWMQSGWEWLSAVILHVLYRVKYDTGAKRLSPVDGESAGENLYTLLSENGRTATLADVHAFMSVGDDDGEDIEGGDEGFNIILEDMAMFDHGRKQANDEVRRAAGRMLKRAGSERSGVHSSATVQLALYSDPIVAKNTSECDFRISDLMNGDTPTSLYIVIPPSDIQRLRPLIRILMNQFLTRLMAEMEFEGGATKKHYKHRLLLMFDEFTSIGKMEIIEKGLAYMAGYGLKAFIIIQDKTQLQSDSAYGRNEAITSNCHVKVAYAPNTMDTAKLLSEMSGKTTVVQKKRSKSHGKGGGSTSDSISEVARPLMTPDECMSMPGLKKNEKTGKVTPGDMLIFVAGEPAIYGRQNLYFQDKELDARSKIAPPIEQSQNSISSTTKTVPSPVDVYEAALQETGGNS